MAVNQLKAGAVLSYVNIGLSNIIGLLYTPFLLRMLGQSEYGLYSLVAAIVGYLTVLDFGFGNAIVRYTAQFRAQNKKDEQYSLFGMFIVLYSAIGLLAFLIGLVLYFNVDLIFGNAMTVEELDKARIMMMLLIFNLAVTFPLSIFGSIITAYENFVFQRVLNIIRVLLQPFIMLPLLFWGYKAIALVVVITVLNIVYLLVNCWYSFYRLKIKVYFRKFNWSLIKEIAQYSFWVFLAVIVDKIYWSSGQFVLGAVAGTVAVAIYAVGMQFQGYYLSFSTAISSVFLPKITAMITRDGSEKEVSDLFIRVGRIQYIIMAFILSGFVIFGKSFILLWAGPDYHDSYLIALIILIPLTIPLIQNLGISILQARNQLKFRSYTCISIAVLSLTFSIPLAKIYGGIGCAVGTSFSLILGNIIAMNIYYYKKIHIDIPRFWKNIIRMTIPVIIVDILFFFLNPLIEDRNFVILLAKASVFALVYIACVYRWGINPYEKDLFFSPLRKIYNKLIIRNI